MRVLLRKKPTNQCTFRKAAASEMAISPELDLKGQIRRGSADLSQGNLTIFKDRSTKAQVGKAVRTSEVTKHVILGYNEFSLLTLPIIE